MDMIERVAAALYEQWAAFFVVSKTWDGAKPDSQAEFRGIARTAIAAMRDCTPAMLDAGSGAHPAGGYVRNTTLNDIIECEWWAMIDAALECSTKLEVK